MAFPRQSQLLNRYRGPTNALHLEVNCNLDAVSDPDERYTAVHSVLFPVESHRSVDLTFTLPMSGVVRCTVSGFETPRMVNVPGMSKLLGPVGTTLEE